MTIGNRELAMSISDGSIKLEKFVLDGADGQAEGNVTADLATLGMNAAFQLTSVVRPLPPPAIPLANWTPPQPKGTLPAVVVLYDGQLDNLAGVTVKSDVANLQRELVVRQMERNVEELEQSRRVDEERVRLEKERRKKLAADRAAALEAARKKQTERLPPVNPESAGTTNSSAQPDPPTCHRRRPPAATSSSCPVLALMRSQAVHPISRRNRKMRQSLRMPAMAIPC